jgi:hypothetical protein
MSAMNAAKARLNSVTASLAPYKTYIQLGLYLFVAVMVVWSIYDVLFPPPNKLDITILTDSRTSGTMNLEKELPEKSAPSTHAAKLM